LNTDTLFKMVSLGMRIAALQRIETEERPNSERVRGRFTKKVDNCSIVNGAPL
jgi:hypothetical protein